MARVVLPDNLEYVNGSTVLYNSNYQEGVQLGDDTLVTDGINIGDHDEYGNSYIRFKTIVRDKTLKKGRNMLVCWESFTVNGIVFKDSAVICVVCDE